MTRLDGGADDDEKEQKVGNVELYDDRSFDYIATRDIMKGEEIVDGTVLSI